MTGSKSGLMTNVKYFYALVSPMNIFELRIQEAMRALKLVERGFEAFSLMEDLTGWGTAGGGGFDAGFSAFSTLSLNHWERT